MQGFVGRSQRHARRGWKRYRVPQTAVAACGGQQKRPGHRRKRRTVAESYKTQRIAVRATAPRGAVCIPRERGEWASLPGPVSAPSKNLSAGGVLPARPARALRAGCAPGLPAAAGGRPVCSGMGGSGKRSGTGQKPYAGGPARAIAHEPYKGARLGHPRLPFYRNCCSSAKARSNPMQTSPGARRAYAGLYLVSCGRRGAFGLPAGPLIESTHACLRKAPLCLHTRPLLLV